MKILQDMFDKIVAEKITHEQIATIAITNCLEQKGIRLTQEQKNKLKEDIVKKGIQDLSISFEDSQLPAEYLPKGSDDLHNIFVDIDAEVDIEKIAQTFIDKISECIPDLISKEGELIADKLVKNAKKMLKDRHSITDEYESTIYGIWAKALDLLETTIVIASETGEDFNKELRENPIPEKSHMIEVMTRLHARACQVASEILTLLKKGYPDGAHARWRCLYEIQSVLHFIADFGEETAEKYLLHQWVESYKAAILYQNDCERLGYEPMSQEEIDILKDKRDKLLERYGQDFNGNYGWAAAETGNRNPTFKEIEKHIKMDHMRSFYKMASHNVHANPKGMLFKLGLSHTKPNILLIGPSYLGLNEPGQGAAISIYQATTALLAIDSNMDSLVACNILERFTRKTMDAFVEVHETIDKEVETK
ncbi:MAG: DUF5677 domain-containing protein [Phycisphaerales bacterium]